MAITTGSAAASTGLAGRLRAAVDSFFSAFTRDYSVGSVGSKGLDCYSQGFVDALNNDRVDATTQLGGAVRARSSNPNGLSIVTGAASTANLITTEYDTHTAITASPWTFTCPTGQAGTYHISAAIAVVTTTNALPNAYIALYVNGLEKARGARIAIAANGTGDVVIATDLVLAVSDQLRLRVFQDSGINVTLEASALTGYASVHRVGGS